MQHRTGGSQRFGRAAGGRPRFASVYPRDSGSAQLLHGCPVVTVEGLWLGDVDHLLVEALTCQLRYVVLRDGAGSIAITLPWQSLYFDAALARLVFYAPREYPAD